MNTDERNALVLRHLGLAKTLIRGRTLAWPSPIGDALPEIEKHRGRPVVVPLEDGPAAPLGLDALDRLLTKTLPASTRLPESERVIVNHWDGTGPAPAEKK